MTAAPLKLALAQGDDDEEEVPSAVS